MTKKLSILIPAIRTHNWKKLYDSAVESCLDVPFELILISPFDLPKELEGKDNIKLVKSFAHPTKAAQLGLKYCEGDLVYHAVDDGIFFSSAIKNAITQFGENHLSKDIINMRYREGQNYEGKVLNDSYWTAGTHGNLRLPGINPNWKIALHFLMRRSYLQMLGGFDCQFEYLNHALHDLMFRAQATGSQIFLSEQEIINCDWQPERTGDHGPIHDAQTEHDEPIFFAMYNNPLAPLREVLLDNYKLYPDYWQRRFKGQAPQTYGELIA